MFVCVKSKNHLLEGSLYRALTLISEPICSDYLIYMIENGDLEITTDIPDLKKLANFINFYISQYQEPIIVNYTDQIHQSMIHYIFE